MSPSDPDVRATLWEVCARPRCGRELVALAVTDDGFRTRHVVAMPAGAWPTITAVGDGAFHVRLGRGPGELIHSDGTTTPVNLDDTTRPIAAGEALVPASLEYVVPYAALDPVTGVAHPVPAANGPPRARAGRGRSAARVDVRNGHRRRVGRVVQQRRKHLVAPPSRDD